MEVDKLNSYSKMIWDAMSLKLSISTNKEEIIYFSESYFPIDDPNIISTNNKINTDTTNLQKLELLIQNIPDRIRDIINAGFEILPVEDAYFARTLFYMSENKLKYIYVSEWNYDRIGNVGDYE